MADWPPELPQHFLAEGYQEAWDFDYVETPMDSGDPKRRPRSSQVDNTIPLKMVCNKAQVERFKAFAKNDLVQMTQRFGALPHMRTGGVVGNVRLVSIDSIRGLSHTDFEVAFTVEYRE